MTPEAQEQVERLIKEAVDDAVRQALDNTAEKKGEERSAEAMVLSPIVTGG
jgi:DNA-binding protein YbaB